MVWDTKKPPSWILPICEIEDIFDCWFLCKTSGIEFTPHQNTVLYLVIIFLSIQHVSVRLVNCFVERCIVVVFSRSPMQCSAAPHADTRVLKWPSSVAKVAQNLLLRCFKLWQLNPPLLNPPPLPLIPLSPQPHVNTDHLSLSLFFHCYQCCNNTANLRCTILSVSTECRIVDVGASS